MLTRNFDSMTTAFMTVFLSGTPTEADWLGGKPGVMKNSEGAIKALTDMSRGSYSTFGHRSDSDNHSNLGDIAPTLLVGSNGAEETYNDYNLDILDKLTAAGYRFANVTYTENGCVYTTVKSFINNTENDITVKELGIYQYYSNVSFVLLYRKKLDTPVTLKANGGTATFSLVIDIPYANKP